MLKPHSLVNEGTHDVYPHTFGNTCFSVWWMGVNTWWQSRTEAQPLCVTRMPPGASFSLHIA